MRSCCRARARRLSAFNERRQVFTDVCYQISSHWSNSMYSISQTIHPPSHRNTGAAVRSRELLAAGSADAAAAPTGSELVPLLCQVGWPLSSFTGCSMTQAIA
jgi:hypothetical protein